MLFLNGNTPCITKIKDDPSGFRAISRNAALELNVFNDYTYTLEMIIQAGRKNMSIISKKRS